VVKGLEAALVAEAGPEAEVEALVVEAVTLTDPPPAVEGAASAPEVASAAMPTGAPAPAPAPPPAPKSPAVAAAPAAAEAQVVEAVTDPPLADTLPPPDVVPRVRLKFRRARSLQTVSHISSSSEATSEASP